MIFGTLFYANYLTRALALYRSLEEHVAGDFELIMLCMDPVAAETCRRLELSRARVVSIGEIERRYPELAAVKPARSIGEYSWTCAPALLAYAIDQVPAGEAAVYLDADLMFFSDPRPVFEEWGENDIAIHEHRYSTEYRHNEQRNGRFNVGWVGIRNSAEGRMCLERWRAQCLEQCTMDPDRGLCGDQTYLNEWPSLYPHLTILQNKGVGLGPWNIQAYDLQFSGDKLHVDQIPVIFYHYHSVRIMHENFFKYTAINPSYYYKFSKGQKHFLYKPYARALGAAAREVRKVSQSAIGSADCPSLYAFAKRARHRDLVYAR